MNKRIEEIRKQYSGADKKLFDIPYLLSHIDKLEKQLGEAVDVIQYYSQVWPENTDVYSRKAKEFLKSLTQESEGE